MALGKVKFKKPFRALLGKDSHRFFYEVIDFVTSAKFKLDEIIHHLTRDGESINIE